MRLNDQTMKDIDRAFKALDAIEQIRAEIQSHIGGCGYINDGLDLALEIIDKYTKGEPNDLR